MRFCPFASSFSRRTQLCLLALATTATCLAAMPGRVHACSCMPQTVEQARRDAEAIFEAHVTQVQASEAQVRVRAKVVRRFQGAAQEQVELTTARDSAMCGYAFEVGESYLVYADLEAEGLSVSLCSRTQRIADADEDLRELGMGVTPFDPGADGEATPPPSSVSPPGRGGCAGCAIGAAPRHAAARAAESRARLDRLAWLALVALAGLAITCRRRSRSRS